MNIFLLGLGSLQFKVGHGLTEASRYLLRNCQVFPIEVESYGHAESYLKIRWTYSLTKLSPHYFYALLRIM
jgi:hypothetical protein